MRIIAKRRFRVDEIAKQKGYTSISSLQKVSGVTYPTLHAIWNNRTQAPDFETLEKIAQALKVTVKDLIADEEAETQVLAGSL